jgi:hypothetical protein
VRQRAVAEGPAALDDRPRPAREPTITVEAKTWVTSLACREAKDLGYPHDAVRAATPAPDAIRYTLDVFTGEGARSNNTDQPFITLATYLAERKGLATFATHVVEAIRDDRRLQAATSLDLILSRWRSGLAPVSWTGEALGSGYLS